MSDNTPLRIYNTADYTVVRTPYDQIVMIFNENEIALYSTFPLTQFQADIINMASDKYTLLLKIHYENGVWYAYYAGKQYPFVTRQLRIMMDYDDNVTDDYRNKVNYVRQ